MRWFPSKAGTRNLSHFVVNNYVPTALQMHGNAREIRKLKGEEPCTKCLIQNLPFKPIHNKHFAHPYDRHETRDCSLCWCHVIEKRFHDIST